MSIDDPTPEQILEFEQAQIDRMQAEETEEAIKVAAETDETDETVAVDLCGIADGRDQKGLEKMFSDILLINNYILLAEERIKERRARQGYADKLPEMEQNIEIISEAVKMILPSLSIHLRGSPTAETSPPFSTIISDVAFKGVPVRSGLIVAGTMLPDTLRDVLLDRQAALKDDIIALQAALKDARAARQAALKAASTIRKAAPEDDLNGTK